VRSPPDSNYSFVRRISRNTDSVSGDGGRAEFVSELRPEPLVRGERLRRVPAAACASMSRTWPVSRKGSITTPASVAAPHRVVVREGGFVAGVAAGACTVNLDTQIHRQYCYVMGPSVFHQRHIGRVLRSSCDVRGRRPASCAVENLHQADALLFGRVTNEMMEAAWRPSAQTVERPDWMEPFARTIDAAKKYVVSSTLDRVDWNAELPAWGSGEGRSAAQAGVG